jgi:peptidoglycan/xylan/chitin deacetylase (PgdA/CDA1 family)
MNMIMRRVWGVVTGLLLLGLAPANADTSVFIYHRFGEAAFPSTHIDPAIFARQLDYLQHQGYQVLPLSQIVDQELAGQTMAEKTVGLSVDDAFVSFAENAWPLLKAHGFPVTLFVNTDSVGTSGYLSWAQLKDLQRQGVEIGHHTASHAYLLEMVAGENFSQWQKRIRADIQRASADFQQHLGRVPQLFAYPYGEYHPVLASLLADMGFVAAFAQQSGVVSPWSDRWALPRFPMGGDYATLSGFVEKLQMKALPVISDEVVDPIIRGQNPPELRLRLKVDALQFQPFNCFVQGQNRCTVQPDPENSDLLLVKAQLPLGGRRNKYTLTTQDKDGRWYWFSQLWVQPHRPLEVINQP